jgi:hypothetical protein
MVDEIINLPTELQSSLLSEEGEVLEEKPMPVHGKKHILLLKSPCVDCAASVFCFETTTAIPFRCGSDSFLEHLLRIRLFALQ